MKATRRYTTIGFLIAAIFFTSFKKKAAVSAKPSVSPTEINFPAKEGTEDLTINGNAQWSVSNAASAWLQLSKTSGNSGSSVIRLTTGSNETGASRVCNIVSKRSKNN